ncbi:MAG: METTL5 family protein [Methanoregulaceae archaeon]|nr:METTL5 family protein [Methanoregulaceae archaeon]
MKLRQLEMVLEGLQGFGRPDPSREQYRTPAPLAARLLFDAFMQGDIENRRVCDLGCGTGVLAIGAGLLGAGEVTGVDSDKDALRIAGENAVTAGVAIGFLRSDISDPLLPGRAGHADTVVMNPPFGAQKQHADRPFIDCALNIADVIYGIFNAGSVPFVRSYTAGRASVEGRARGTLRIPHQFSFHTRTHVDIGVEILRITRNAG